MSERDMKENKTTNQMPDQQEGADPVDTGNRKRRITVIVVAVVFLLVVAAVVAGVLVTRERHTAALEDCTRSSKAYKTSIADQKSSQEQAQKVLTTIPAQNTADPKIHASLEQATLKKADRTIISCSASQSTTELKQSKDRLDKATSANKQLARLNKDGVAKVEASARAKTLNDEKQALDATISAASALLGDSDGKVADNAVRESLSKALDDARQVSGKKDITDPKTYTDAKQALDGAVNAVNDSIGQKQAADEITAAQVSAASGTGSAYAGGGTAGNGYSGGGYSGGGYTGGGYSGGSTGGYAPGVHLDSGTVVLNPGTPPDATVEFEACGILGSAPNFC